jgi:DNA sulfur modification protein DndD
LIKEIRQQKTLIDKRIDDIDARINELSKEIGGLQKDINSKIVVVTQLSKKIKINELDYAKDIAAERMIGELDAFIYKLKLEKKYSLESRLKEELNSLMHKKEFIGKVNVELKADIIDIYLFDKKGKEINKETLSKGEQQLYATALLKSLVDESNIHFPVFVDSPLQKFDKKHSLNVITEFYPRISEQVVIFPLLEKELTEVEYHLLLPKVSKVFLIDNQAEYHSRIIEINPQHLFAKARDLYEHIYQH